MKYYDEHEKENIIKLRKMVSEFPSFCLLFFRGIEQQATSLTRISYAYDINIFLNFLKQFLNKTEIELSDLDSISSIDIETYMEYLKYYKNNDTEFTNSAESVKRKIASLRTFYKYFYMSGLIKTNPTLKIKLPKIREKEIIRLEIDETAKLLNNIETGVGLTKKEKEIQSKTRLRDMALISLLLGTGIRVSECIGINFEDIDMENTSIGIKRKGGKETIIYISDEVAEILDKYITERKKINVIDKKSVNALFLSLQNKRISVRAVENLVKKYAKTVTALKHITPHKLRSTFGTNLYNETGDIYLVAGVLGHNDVNTTKKHYTTLEENKKRDARNIVKLR